MSNKFFAPIAWLAWVMVLNASHLHFLEVK